MQQDEKKWQPNGRREKNFYRFIFYLTSPLFSLFLDSNGDKNAN
jgi:hypothetical protein